MSSTPWLNYHHLLYFWTVAREGSVTKASRQLRLAQPTVSAQLKALEDSLGERLLSREGRGVQLTEMGQIVFRYAEQIFNLGREMVQTVQRYPSGIALELRVGIADVLPKTIAFQLLEPALAGPEKVKIVCREGTAERLVAEMATHELDLVLSDAPMSSHSKIQAYNHLLGESEVAFFCVDKLWRQFHKDFPRSLNGAPFLLPLRSANFRRGLEQWFYDHDIVPDVIWEIEDSALIKVFGGAGKGILAAPLVSEDELKQRFDLRVLGKAEQFTTSIYAISVERKIKHPGVVAICKNARQRLLA